MYKTKPICSRCGIEMDVHMQGVTVVEMAYNPPTPYAMVSADEFKCQSCGYRVISRFADKPFSNHHDEDFKSKLWEIVQDNPMKIRGVCEYLPSAKLSRDKERLDELQPVAYLLEWLRLESMVKSIKED